MCMLTSLKVRYAITVMLLHWKVNAFHFVFIHAEPVKINTTTLYEDILSVVLFPGMLESVKGLYK